MILQIVLLIFFAVTQLSSAKAATCLELFSDKVKSSSTIYSSVPSYSISIETPRQRIDRKVKELKAEISLFEADNKTIEGKIKADSSKESMSGWSIFSFDKKSKSKLSAEELAKLEAQRQANLTELANLENKLKQKNEELSALDEVSRNAVRSELKSEMRDPSFAAATEDLISFYTLSSLPKSSKVTLLIGNEEGALIASSKSAVEDFQAAIKLLKKKNYLILFEGNSVLAPIIHDIAGDSGVALYASNVGPRLQSKNALTITNDYLRMQVLGEADGVVAVGDSMSGIGLTLEGLVTHVWNLAKHFEKKELAAWERDLNMSGRNLGVRFDAIRQIDRLENLFSNRSSISTDYDRPFNLSSPSFSSGPAAKEFLSGNTSPVALPKFKIDLLSLSSLERLLSEAKSFVRVMNENRGTGGSVFFGSSQTDRHSTPLIYESAYRLSELGYAVTTGGAGGAMQTANEGAYNAGGPSIGIPISGRSALKDEHKVASGVQTLTIPTSGYEERIPALLGSGEDSRRIVVFAPGGSGTIKELAVTFVRLSQNPDLISRIVFLDSKYYGGLVGWILKKPIPEYIKRKIVLIDNASEIAALGKNLLSTVEASRDIKPRKNQPQFKESEPQYRYSSSDDAYDIWDLMQSQKSSTDTPDSSNGVKKEKAKSKSSDKRYKIKRDQGDEE
jgi:predicted Rossmann-fold nucleotide-binding protein